MRFIILQLVKVISQTLDTFINKAEKKYHIFFFFYNAQSSEERSKKRQREKRKKKSFSFLLSFPDAYMHLHMNGLKLSAFYQASPQPPFKKSNQTLA